jgi:phenylacetate-CoA ligase
MNRPHSAKYWDERETWPRDRIAAHQEERLKAQLASLYERSPFHRDRLGKAGWKPGDLKSAAEITKLPIMRKADYVAAVNAALPWGTHLAVPLAQVRRVHFSSGTTTKPVPDCWTATDLDRWADLYARFAYAQGVRETDVFQCLFNLSWFVGGLGGMASYQKIGAACIPAGSVDSERQVRTLFDFGTTAICATPSFAAHLIEVARGMGLDLRTSKVKRIALGGEPGANIPATRKLIEDGWDAKAFDAYGSLEFQPIAWDCEAQTGPHLCEDFAVAEILDPETEKPVADGAPGVLVLTHLDKEAVPLVRWWTGDVVVRDSSPCACGRTHARLAGGVRGRADDMLIVRGVNVFPSAVEDVVRRTPGLTGEYQIVLDADVMDAKTGFLTGLKVRVEREASASGDVGAKLADALRILNVRAVVEVKEPGELPRTTHKAKRIIKEGKP